MLGQTFSGAFPSWVVGVNVGYPIGRSAARGEPRATAASEEQAEINLRNLELSGRGAASASRAQRPDRTSRSCRPRTRHSTRRRKQLDAENRKKEQGLSDPFTLLQKQQILSQARVSDRPGGDSYNVAILTFERLQRVR